MSNFQEYIKMMKIKQTKSKCCKAEITCCNRCDTVICENPLCSKCKKPFEPCEKGACKHLLEALTG